MENWIILLLDLFGTAVFAVTGAVQGVRRNLDIFGVTVLACCVGVGGGMIRDCITGTLPAAALCNQHYIIICIATGLITFASARYWIRKRNIIKICDAIGLGVFAALGAEKGAACGLNLTGVVLCGVFTAIGGGMIRDVLTVKIPVVLKSDFYATAALIGAVIYYILVKFDISFFLRFSAVALLVTTIRMLAIIYKLRLPAAGRFLNRKPVSDK
ncbi:MAG: trimeric intracellular cation channel family protein [Lentisphaeria bacterium]|nr:trimeric intracellular cation channel family protein [Lentisphaeria bacterium]MBO7154153.1 trimeric intracellular cation channel family protein [Lentisphaeria bacterium]